MLSRAQLAGGSDARSSTLRPGERTTDIAGLYDGAYSSTLTAAGITTNTLVIRSGSVEILITSRAPIDNEKALAQKLFAAI